MLALTNEGDTVFDPFVGVGSTIIAAIMHQRNGMGMELDEKYIEIAERRIKEYQNGKLNIRPLGKPVHQPTGREKVSQIPLSWINNN